MILKSHSSLRHIALIPVCLMSSLGLAVVKQTNRLTITGSSTIAPLVLEIGKRFESQKKGVRVDVQTGGSSRGLADATQGLADIGMVSRELKREEQGALFGFPIARDGICIIIHRDNPIRALDDRQIVGIYTGKFINWNEVGGNKAPITVVNKANGRSTLELFIDYFKLQASDVKAQVIIGDNAQAIKTVAGNPNSIGYVSIGSAEFESKDGVPIKLLPIGGLANTKANQRHGKYPLSRSLLLVTKTNPEGLVKEFIEFSQSRRVHDLVEDQFFVSVAQ